MIKHACSWIKTINDLPDHLEEIEQIDSKWFYHHELKADEKWVYDGEASYVGEVLCNHKIPINFCPYCGEQLNDTLAARHADFHKQLAPPLGYPEPPPENYFQCPEIEAYYHDEKERWFIIRAADGICWMLEKFISATEEMVQMEEADYVGEFCFMSGLDILFCPFCGELLDAERLRQISSL